MVNSILIGKYIYKVLSEDTEIPENVFPLIANADTPFPYITFEKEGINPEYCKDGCISDSVSVIVNVYSNDYTESCEIANRVRKLLEFKSYRSSEFNVKDCRLSGVSEDYSETFNYNQQLIFNLIIQ